LADRDKLHQVLVNLVGNAVKFTPAGGSVTVSARTVTAAGGQGAGVRGGTRFIEVEVADTGEGVPAEQLDMIFDKFYQVRRGNHHKTPGTGLGLAIARSLIELQGGRLWVESEIGRGSCFVFTLPLAESQ
jgi:signal transduction histidine kinase